MASRLHQVNYRIRRTIAAAAAAVTFGVVSMHGITPASAGTTTTTTTPISVTIDSYSISQADAQAAYDAHGDNYKETLDSLDAAFLAQHPEITSDSDKADLLQAIRDALNKYGICAPLPTTTTTTIVPSTTTTIPVTTTTTEPATTTTTEPATTSTTTEPATTTTTIVPSTTTTIPVTTTTEPATTSTTEPATTSTTEPATTSTTVPATTSTTIVPSTTTTIPVTTSTTTAPTTTTSTTVPAAAAATPTTGATSSTVVTTPVTAGPGTLPKTGPQGAIGLAVLGTALIGGGVWATSKAHEINGKLGRNNDDIAGAGPDPDLDDMDSFAALVEADIAALPTFEPQDAQPQDAISAHTSERIEVPEVPSTPITFTLMADHAPNVPAPTTAQERLAAFKAELPGKFDAIRKETEAGFAAIRKETVTSFDALRKDLGIPNRPVAGIGRATQGFSPAESARVVSELVAL